jgi:hypothetical protein
MLERGAAFAEEVGDYDLAARVRCDLAWIAMLDRDAAQQARDRYVAGGGRNLAEVLRRWRAWEVAQHVLDHQVSLARLAADRVGASA